MVNLENYYQEYIVYAKYQIVSTLSQQKLWYKSISTSLHMHYLSTNKTPLNKQNEQNC